MNFNKEDDGSWKFLPILAFSLKAWAASTERKEWIFAPQCAALSLSLLTSDKKLARQFLSFPDLYDSNHSDKTVFIYLFNHTLDLNLPLK